MVYSDGNKIFIPLNYRIWARTGEKKKTPGIQESFYLRTYP